MRNETDNGGGAAAATTVVSLNRAYARRRSSGVNSTDSLHDIEAFLVRELDLTLTEESEEFLHDLSANRIAAAGRGDSFRGIRKKGEERKRRASLTDSMEDIETFLENTQMMLKKRFVTSHLKEDGTSKRRISGGERSADSCDSVDVFLSNAENQRESLSKSLLAAAAMTDQQTMPNETFKKKMKNPEDHANPGAVWVKGYNNSNNNEDEDPKCSTEGDEEIHETNTSATKKNLTRIDSDRFYVVAEAVEESVYNNSHADIEPAIIVTAKPESWRQRHLWWLIILVSAVVVVLINISILYSKSRRNYKSFPTFTDSDRNDNITLSPLSFDEDDEPQNAVDFGWNLNINEGTISPLSSTSDNKDDELVLGVTDNPQLILTKKGNPNELTFSKGELINLQSNRNSNGTILHGIGIQNSHLEPRLHDKWLFYEGTAVTTTNEDSSSPSSVMLEYINLTYLVLRGFNSNNNTKAATDNDMILGMRDSDFSEGTSLSFVTPNVKEGEEVDAQFVSGRGRDWTLNTADGTISPKSRPDLVLGYGQRYLIITRKDSSQARRFQNLSKLQNGESASLQFVTTNGDNDNINNSISDEIGIGIIKTSQPKYFYQWIYIETKVISSINKEDNNNKDLLVTIRHDNNNQIFMSSIVIYHDNDSGDNTITTKAALLMPFLFQVKDGTRVIFVEME